MFEKNYISNEDANFENMLDKNGNISITVKASAFHIIIGLISILIGVLGFLLHKTDDISTRFSYIVFLCSGFLLLVEYINFELRLDGDEIYHKNLFGVERWLKLSDITTYYVTNRKRIYTIEFSQQCDKAGNYKECNRKLFLYTDTKEGKMVAQYISNYYRYYIIEKE